ncbi:uncharacterized protein EKO05_0004902 [Ascochyta rabiei]|uniref:Uncharacterized protein n=1 Tax=Didymella rabiei TaxID=5454 RepID=A0A163D4Z8_DIDRA|nr:uncharacterized protein EKO05_0004902 [Ascochyta rabiei]KZM22915.1 hypothetical protein ST47_g5916 [Ascochyta rabiei]UPX14420.1 hypothetical protein EKO05_0004902 [Ascochyta rabiei]
MSRRQSRNKQPTSYRVEDEYSFLDEDVEPGPSRSRRSIVQEDEEDGDDFMPDAHAEDEPEDDFEDDLVEEEESEEEPAADEEALVRGSSIIDVDDNDGTPSRTSSSKRKGKRPENVLPQAPAPRAIAPVQVPHSFTRSGGRKVNMDDDKMRSRGVADFSKQGGQEVRLKDLFGPALTDLRPILRTRDTWRLQETLPIRGSGLMRSYFESTEARTKDEKLVQTWYAKHGRANFVRGQKTSLLSQEQGSAYMLNNGADSINVLMGPPTDPQLHPLEKNSFVNIADPFENKAERRGSLLNLGSRIQDAQWMTNEDGGTQYLAVAVEQRDMTTQQPLPMGQSTAPAFSATKPFAASVQIWAFESTKTCALDPSKKPRLALVICTDWGAPKQLRWSPIKPHDRDLPLDDARTDQIVDVGILAGIWSDGRVRVLNIEIPKTDAENTETTFLQISQAAFDTAIPQTVPTCLQWLSGSTLAVGTSAGTLAIWTLTRPGTLSTTGVDGASPRPWFYKQIGDTYVLTLLSGWPSQPHFLSASTADGFARLYDIRSPDADNVVSVRGRVLVVTQAWHEHTQSFIMPDEHYILKHNSIRRFYHNIYSARAESSIVRVAASPVHPGVLIGGANGTVFATNPVGRVVNTKVVPWQQNWFVHEWRPPVENMVALPDLDVQMQDEEVTEVPNSNSSKVPTSVLSEPMVRITEGYRATQPGIQYSTASKKKPENENSTLITIYEEQSSISALSWNPNLRFGTWAVAGMNSGLLRVEDIGV